MSTSQRGRFHRLALFPAAISLMVLSIFSPAFAATSLLRCQAKDAVGLEDNGTLSKDMRLLKGLGDSWLTDTETGMVRTGGVTGVPVVWPVHWIVVQEGNDSNDTVLVLTRQRHPGAATDFSRDDLKDAATDFIRIRRWKGQSTILFTRFGLSTLVSGTCEPVNP